MMHLTPLGHSKSIIDETSNVTNAVFDELDFATEKPSHNDKNEFLNGFNAVDDNVAYISGELSETFSHLDPDLAMLFKEMKGAASVLTSARNQGGDALSTAKWKLESAQCAYQTRLLEVRRNHILNKAQQETLDKTEGESMRISHELTMQDRMNEQFAALRKKRLEQKKRKEEQSSSWLLYFLIGLWIANMARQNRLQNALPFSAQNDFTSRANAA